jgi:hypothetical protein
VCYGLLSSALCLELGFDCIDEATAVAGRPAAAVDAGEDAAKYVIELNGKIDDILPLHRSP